MDKLELDLDDLEVSSFTTAPRRDEADGTVEGNGKSVITPTQFPTNDPREPTCGYGYTCDGTCNDTCDGCDDSGGFMSCYYCP